MVRNIFLSLIKKLKLLCHYENDYPYSGHDVSGWLRK
jgi:hypothetical protein